ncbi:MAG: GHKL domain-containing protein [Chitinivibrionales bacterium]|nr:GHKL domain-containing protein [Chitinivibrionales bacterium]MBD3358102.1 GHKL domain-containing protein [Chitinivibrionales bacterium]
MAEFIIEAIWIFLLATGILFVALEYKTRLAPSVLYFGITIMLLCGFAAVDIWIIPRSSNKYHLYWFEIQHMLGSFIMPMLLLYVLVLLKAIHKRLIQAFFFISALFALSFFTPMMLRQRADGVVVGTVWYLTFLVPYVVLTIALVHAFMIKHWAASSQEQRRAMKFHVVGFAFLSFCGLVDIFMLFDFIPRSPVYGFTIVGILGFGVINSAMFLEHFAFVVKDYKNTYHKLESAYRDLDEANALKEIGMSSAMIAHEIKNYMFVIGGHAQLLQRSNELSDIDRKKVTSIETAVETLTAFSRDVLDLARSRVVHDKHVLDLEQLIRKCAAKYESLPSNFFEITAAESPMLIHGNWGRLEQVFTNIFNNAIEANCTHISIRLMQRHGMLLVSIHDNGDGCTPEQASSLFTAFYTTKKGKKGTGLGLSIVRAIIQSHGGHISAYGKNSKEKTGLGLMLNLTFPILTENGEQAQNDCDIAIIKTEIEYLPQVLQVLHNVRIQPRILESVSEATKTLVQGRTRVLASATVAPQLLETGMRCSWHALVSDPVHGIRVIPSEPDSAPELFSEEYVLTRMQT